MRGWAKQALVESGAEAAMLSGSGSAVFGVFESIDQAEEAAIALAARFPWVMVSKSLKRI